MAKLNPKQVGEINEIIAQIEKVVKPKSEIGAQSKLILNGLLASTKTKKKISFFKCKPEYSEEIVSFFVSEKGVAKSKYHTNNKDSIFVIQ